MHANAEPGRFRWGYVVVAMGLVLILLFPAIASAQGIKDEVSDDPATEEATEEPLDDSFDDPDFDPDDEPSDASDLEAAGLIDDDAYESPQFGYTIEWSRDWEVDYAIEEFNDHLPVISDEGNEQDRLYLVWFGGPGEESYAIVSGQTANRGGPDGDVEEWLDPDYIMDPDQWDPTKFDVEPLLDDSTRDTGAVLYSVIDTENNDAQYYTIYQSIEYQDGFTLYLTFSAHEDWFEASYASWSEDIEIYGEPVDVVFGWDDIEDEI